MLKNGKVLLLERPADNSGFKIGLWDPANEGTDPVLVADPPPDPENPAQKINLFCSGHAQLADGRIAFFGGGQSQDASHGHTVIFNPDASLSNPWTLAGDMPIVGSPPLARRWYPRVTTLGDGSVLVLGGGSNDGTQGTCSGTTCTAGNVGAPCAYTLRLIVTDQAAVNCNDAIHNQSEYTVSVDLGSCLSFDADHDGDVDLFDFFFFEDAFTGPR